MALRNINISNDGRLARVARPIREVTYGLAG